MEELIAKFNLPTYIKGKSFSDASALINKKFEGRVDPESISTKKELMGRLRQAQDYVKSFMEPEQPPAEQLTPTDANDFDSVQRSTDYNTVGQNQNFLGGILSKAASKGGGVGMADDAAPMTQGAEGANPMGGVAGGIDKVKSAAEIVGSFVNKPDVDTSGQFDAPERMSGAESAFSGAAKGAELGSIAGPYGQAAGAVVGAIGGAVQAGKHNKAQVEAARNSTYRQAGATTNTFRRGGFLSKIFGFNKQGEAANNPAIDYDQIDADLSAGAGDNANRFTPDEVGDLPDTLPSTATNPTVGGDFDAGLAGAQALRYAPVVANAAQLLSLKKPDQEGLDRLGNRYEKQTTDKQYLQNIISGQVVGNREAITNASGGSASATRANLLANNLQGTKATSDAYFDALRADQSENRAEQQFNLGVDQVNIQQANAENDINARNKGNYDTQKSRLIAQLGQDAGSIGKEELFKKYPELMGSNYNWLGKYKKSKK